MIWTAIWSWQSYWFLTYVTLMIYITSFVMFVRQALPVWFVRYLGPIDTKLWNCGKCASDKHFLRLLTFPDFKVFPSPNIGRGAGDESFLSHRRRIYSAVRCEMTHEGEGKRSRPSLRVDNRVLLWFIDHPSTGTIHDKNNSSSSLSLSLFADIYGNDSGGRQPLQGASNIRPGKTRYISWYWTNMRGNVKARLREFAICILRQELAWEFHATLLARVRMYEYGSRKSLGNTCKYFSSFILHDRQRDEAQVCLGLHLRCAHW